MAMMARTSCEDDVSKDVDILIVGAGLAGAATAHHLARKTRRSLLVVEREAVPGVHSSGRNAAIVRERPEDVALAGMMREGAAALRDGRLAAFDRRGLMLLGLGESEVATYCPPARGRGAWYPDDGTVDVAGLLRCYLAGLAVRYDTGVLGWTSSGDRLRVETTRGEIVCRWLVNAAGPWAGHLGDLPLTPMNRHLFVTAPLDWVDARWPTVWDCGRGLYFRPESGGLLLCACDESAAAPGDYGEAVCVLDDLAQKVATLQPGLGSLSIARSWVGQRTFAPDRRFVIGFDPRDARVFHVAGLGGHGVTASYAVGRLAAAMLSEDGPVGVAAFAPDRLFAATV